MWDVINFFVFEIEAPQFCLLLIRFHIILYIRIILKKIPQYLLYVKPSISFIIWLLSNYSLMLSLIFKMYMFNQKRVY